MCSALAGAAFERDENRAQEHARGYAARGLCPICEKPLALPPALEGFDDTAPLVAESYVW